MLTRSEVARRIGKSIATVRRLEGVHLFPRQARNGVHWFDRGDVERLKRNIEDGLLLPWGRSAPRPSPVQLPKNENEIADLRARVKALEETLEELVEALGA